MEEIRPQGTAARRLVPFMGGLSALGLLILVFSLALNISARTEGFGGTMFAVGGLGVVYLLLWQRNARLLAGSGLVGQRNLVGQTTTFQTSDVGRLLIATVIYSKNSTPQRVLYVLSPSGQALMMLNIRAWGDEAIAKVVDATGKSIEYRDAPISSREFKAEFPNAVSWAALHPTLLGGGIVVAALVLAIGIPIAWALLSKQ
ncbi:MAG TPA: hypothetical protein VNF91_08355 [Candidatus Acidoferrum sp.]|nr:hypothetical protein [Candidatus Acidoferrum sp.]